MTTFPALRRGLVQFLAVVLLLLLVVIQPVLAGGPILVVGIPPDWNPGVSGQFWRWNTASAVQYRTDAGNLGADNNAAANTRVQSMFQVWQDVTTANISYNRAGALLAATGLAAGADVDTVAEFNAARGSCDAGTQSPIIFDADGTLFTALGSDPDVIGFAGPCAADLNGIIASGMSALNGKWIDGNMANGELTSSEFNGAFIHEFGHFSGLDHSQANLTCKTSGCADNSDDTIGLPTMFPFVIGDVGGNGVLEEAPGVASISTLAEDDKAWISFLYPETANNPGNGQVPFSSVYGMLSGLVLFSDGQSPTQGVNVLARETDNQGTPQDESRRNAVSGVSGVRFTTSVGQTVSGTNDSGDTFYGSRDAALIGAFEIPVLADRSYTLEVESIDPDFTGGSGINPFIIAPIPMPGTAPGLSGPIEVFPGLTTGVPNIVLVGTDARYDQFEDVGP